MKITHNLLIRHSACDEELEIFDLLWPQGCYPTPENIQLALLKDLDVQWLQQFLTPENNQEFQEYRQQRFQLYRTQYRPSWEIYEQAHKPLYTTYRTTDQDFKTYQQLLQPYLNTYMQVRDPLYTKYITDIMSLLGSLLLAQS